MQTKTTNAHGNHIYELRMQEDDTGALYDALSKGVMLTNPDPSRTDKMFGNSGHHISWTEIHRLGNGFPTTSGTNINMLPFIMGDKSSLPKEVQQYFPMIEACDVEPDQIGKVLYLTIQESDVLAGQTQRRGGLHIEAPPACTGGKGAGGMLLYHWGGGAYGGKDADSKDRPRGGIYMASNVSNSTAVYDAQVRLKSISSGPPIGADGEVVPWAYDDDFNEAGNKQAAANVGEHGDIEHLRPIFEGTEFHLFPNTIYWMTDRTPHEALPVEAGTHRQYFRLVTSDISVWYRFHSTANPKVAVPDGIQIIEGSKFMSARDRRAFERDEQRK